MVAESARIGAVYADDMWVDQDIQKMLAEFRRFLPKDVRTVSARTHIPAHDATAEFHIQVAENGEIEDAARRLMRYNPQCIAYMCTTISFSRGLGYDIELRDRIEDATGIPATTTTTAVIKALKALGLKKIATAAPYLDIVNDILTEFLEGSGVEVVNSRTLNLARNHSCVPAERIRRLAEEADVTEAEALLIACTGQKTAGFIADLERKGGKPVVTASQATMWHALQLVGVEPCLPDLGKLYSEGR